MFVRRGVLAALLVAIAPWPGGEALALEKVRLGKAVPNSFALGATEVGIEAKIFEAEGIEVEVTSFRGDAQLQQALAAAAWTSAWVRALDSASAPRGRRRSGLPPCMDRRPISRWWSRPAARSGPSRTSRASASG